jgi:uracil-DNA glycosylase
MSLHDLFVNQIVMQAEAARDVLLNDPIVGPFVEASLAIPRPYLGAGDIRLIIIGQDPTVKRTTSRSNVTTVLNLDKPGNLRSYLADICSGLGLSLDGQVYATNVCKCFFTFPPTEVQKQYRVDVLTASAALWLSILRQELARFPDALVISLGEPVLSVLVAPGASRLLKHYWGYHRRWQQGESERLRAIEPTDSTVDRRIFPFIHQLSLQKAFYKIRLSQYIAFVQSCGAQRQKI